MPSKEVAETPEVEWGPSTVRAELAALEAAGYLTHPHTSAGRVPTDSGYRRYVDLLLESGAPPADAAVELELSRLRREVDEAMRETTAALAQVTDLVALATAPPPAARRRSTGSRCCACSRHGWWWSRSPPPATSPSGLRLRAGRSTPAWSSGPPAT